MRLSDRMLSLGCLKFKYLIIRDISDKIRQDLHQFRQNPTKSDIHIDKFYMCIISSYDFPMKMTIRPKRSVGLDLGQPQDPTWPRMKAVAAYSLACSTAGCYKLRPPPGGYILSPPPHPLKKPLHLQHRYRPRHCWVLGRCAAATSGATGPLRRRYINPNG